MEEGKLFENLISFSNLLLAFQKAKKAKGEKREILEFEYDLEKNLLQMQTDLTEGKYVHGNYRQFVVSDSKRREIKAAPFRDRVLHHAVCNLMEPIFDPCFIFDSFACRKEKGTHSAVKRLKKFLQSVQALPAKRERERERESNSVQKFQETYCLKCDIRKYFASIDHLILKRLIKRKILDRNFFQVVEMIIESSFEKLEYESLLKTRKIGIPIGNLTSQLFANIYLNELDQFVKHKLRFRHYIRYMDDFLFLHPDKKYLKEIKEKTGNFLKENLKLDLHPKKAEIFPIRCGIDFLGYRLFYPAPIRLRKGTVKRFLKRMKKYKKIGKDEEKVVQSLASWHGYAKHADSFALINSLLNF